MTANSEIIMKIFFVGTSGKKVIKDYDSEIKAISTKIIAPWRPLMWGAQNHIDGA